MINAELLRLMNCFPQSFITRHEEFIAHPEANEYFLLAKIEGDTELKYKTLEWLSRGACITEPFKSKKKNNEFNSFMLSGINMFLGTNFTKDDMVVVYTYLGNRCNRTLTEEFVASGYDMEILRRNDLSIK